MPGRWSTAFGINPLLFPMAVVFFISSLAETQRAPFDLTEAESELVAGYQTEYSSMSFALFWLGEYANVILMCALNAILFWGGYLPPLDWAPLYAVPGIIWLFAKILFFFFLFSWVKATVPRYRYDQLMRLGWKMFLPLSLFWVFLVSGVPDVAARGSCRHERRPDHQVVHAVGVHQGARADLELFLQAQGDDQLSVREEPDLARGSAASMRCAAIPMARSAASRASCARRCARRWRSRSRPSRATTAAAARRATTST